MAKKEILEIKRNRTIPIGIILIFFALAAGALAAGSLYYLHYSKRLKEEARKNLSTVADLKTAQIANWRRERLWDGETISENRFAASFVKRFLGAPGKSGLAPEVLQWLKSLQGANYQNVFLIDEKGIVRLSATEGEKAFGALDEELVKEALREKKAVLTDFQKSGGVSYIHLDLIVPLLVSRGRETEAVGALIMRINPRNFLYPLIQSWPAPSRTSETLLVERDGNDVLFLNELRFGKNAALFLRLPLSSERLPAAAAVLGKGQEIMEGVDYRGKRVLAAIRDVPDTPWHMVAKTDVGEVYEPLVEHEWLLALLVGFIVVASGLGAGLWWRHKSTAAIGKLNEELKRHVLEVEAANRELDAFSYSVSHDLRAPLRAIDGFSRIILEDYPDRLDAEGKRLLNVIRSNTQRMGRLIDDLLNLSRIGRREMKLADINMEKLVREVFEEVRQSAPGREMNFELGPLPDLRADRALIRQALINLFSNAVKFTRTRAIARIRAGGMEEGGEKIYYVGDNGVGFEMKYADKLFGVFQRLHAADEFEGTGIGLAIVSRIVLRHGGRVWAEGKVNEGATFYFALPKQSV